MDYSFIPSLEYAALGKIAIALWNQEDARAFIVKFVYQSPNVSQINVKLTIDDVVKEKTLQLSLPRLLEKKLIYLSKPIGLEILHWKQHHEKFLPKEFVEASLGELRWTQLGTVDRKSTAEVLIRNEDTDITIRYKLACIYCLEHDIPALWDKIPQHLRKDFYSESSPTDIKQEFLVVFWTYTVNGKRTKLIQSIGSQYHLGFKRYKYACETSIFGGNCAAAEYFLHKMTRKGKSKHWLRFAYLIVQSRMMVSFQDIYGVPMMHYSRTLYYLLSQMTEEQQAELFRRQLCEVLKCFLDWPLQNLFLRMVKSLWTFLSEEVYHHLLCAVVRKVIDGSEDFNYQKLFGELWQQGPYAYKEHVINKSISTCELLLFLFQAEDENNISLIFSNVSIQEKENFIFSYLGKNICKILVDGNKWKLVKFFIQEFTSSNKTRNKFKKRFKKYIFHGPDKIPEKKDIWEKFFKDLHFNQKNLKGEHVNERE